MRSKQQDLKINRALPIGLIIIIIIHGWVYQKLNSRQFWYEGFLLLIQQDFFKNK